MTASAEKPADEPASPKRGNAEPPSILAASIADALTALKVNPDAGLTRAEIAMITWRVPTAVGILFPPGRA